MSTAAPVEEVPVAIAGGGPVGLALGLGLARHGVRSVVLERDPTTTARSKAPGVHLRTLEALDRWGAGERLRAAGVLVPGLTLRRAGDDAPLFTVDLSMLDDEADRPGLLVLEQAETERLLLEALRSTGLAEVRFSTEVLGVDQDQDRVRVRHRSPEGEGTLVARYAVGCDGAHSRVRAALGLPFPGVTYRLEAALADVRIDGPRDRQPWPRIDVERRATTLALRLGAGVWRLIRLQPPGAGVPDPGPGEVAAWVEAVLGPGGFEVLWASRFRLHRRTSPRFRVGRVLLAGDAAHVHSPVGGQGLNAGIQDVHDLAWKLAAALAGGDADRLLAAYEVERRRVVGEVSRFTHAATRVMVQTPPAVRRAAFAAVRAAGRVRAVHRRMARRLAMIDLGAPPSPLLRRDDRAAGVRLPNVRLVDGGGGGPVRVYDLLPVGAALIDVTDSAGDGPAPGDLPVERVIRVGPGGYRDPSGRLRALAGGAGAILVRPDGLVAWALDRRADLREAARRALGLPT